MGRLQIKDYTMKSTQRHLILSSIIIACGIAYSQEPIDEAALFSDTSMIVSDTQLVDNALLISEKPAEKRVGFSGEVTSAGVAMLRQNLFEGKKGDNTTLAAFITGNLFLDARLPMDMKVFSNIETQYLSFTQKPEFWLRELFFDVNIKRRVYFRTGKQVLQWGRCNFWNPTDLINIEKKSFIQKIGYREGSYGLKMHVPFGAKYNLYGFLSTNNIYTVDSIAGAAKAEALFGRTEMALSLYGRRGFIPVPGFDISTRIGDVLITGEVSANNSKNYFTLTESADTASDTLVLGIDKKGNNYTPRACIGLSYIFNAFNIDDRISVSAEFYYNHGGYDENIFADDNTYKYKIPVKTIAPNGMETPVWTGDKKTFFMNNYFMNLYDQHNYSKYYLALFTTINKFITSDMTLYFNGMANLQQECGIITGYLMYRNMHNLSLGFMVNGFVGKENTEYTYSKDVVVIRLTAGIAF